MLWKKRTLKYVSNYLSRIPKLALAKDFRMLFSQQIE